MTIRDHLDNPLPCKALTQLGTGLSTETVDDDVLNWAARKLTLVEVGERPTDEAH